MSGGGHDVGWVVASEWLRYSVNVSAAGSVRHRCASRVGRQRRHIPYRGGRQISAGLTVPNTGGWQKWMTLRKVASLYRSGHRMAAGRGLERSDRRGRKLQLHPRLDCRHWAHSVRRDARRCRAPCRSRTSMKAERAWPSPTRARKLRRRIPGDRCRHRITSDSGGGYNVGWASAGSGSITP